jgi:hypothetical protein
MDSCVCSDGIRFLEAGCRPWLVPPASSSLLGPQQHGEFGFVSPGLLDKALGVVAPDEGIERVFKRTPGESDSSALDTGVRPNDAGAARQYPDGQKGPHAGNTPHFRLRLIAGVCLRAPAFRMTPERRLLRMAVSNVDDAVAECARLEELEVDTSVAREQGFASAESHGVDEQVVLVDEPVRCESRG